MELDVGTELLRGTSGQGFDGGFVELDVGTELLGTSELGFEGGFATCSEVSVCTKTLDCAVNQSIGNLTRIEWVYPTFSKSTHYLNRHP